MQLNVYVPKAKAAILRTLDERARRTGRQKNELVLEALEAYLRATAVAEEKPVWRTYNLGFKGNYRREDAYLEEEDLSENSDDSTGH